jgi:N-acylmannosamine kinase
MDAILCVDLGGTKVAYGVAEGPNCRSLVVMPVPPTYNGLLSQLRSMLARGFDCLAIATAGIVVNHRSIGESPNLHWLDGKNLADEIEVGLGARCWIANDMEAAATAELRFGELNGVRCGLVECISTGWGGCTAFNLHRREYVIPGEPGHVMTMGDLSLCGCGRRGCAEARFSGAAVRTRLYREFGNQIPPRKDPCAFLDEQAALGQDWAIELYREIATGIGLGWANSLNRNSWIEKIVYTGTFAINGMRFMESRIREMLDLYAKFPSHKQIPVVHSKLWPFGGLVGAAVIFRERNDSCPKERNFIHDPCRFPKEAHFFEAVRRFRL